MDWSGELFMRPLEGNFGVHSLLWSSEGNKHQHNARVSAWTFRHDSTCIIYFLTRHNEPIHDKQKRILTHRLLAPLLLFTFFWWRHHWLLMTSQMKNNNSWDILYVSWSLEVGMVQCTETVIRDCNFFYWSQPFQPNVKQHCFSLSLPSVLLAQFSRHGNHQGRISLLREIRLTTLRLRMKDTIVPPRRVFNAPGLF